MADFKVRGELTVKDKGSKTVKKFSKTTTSSFSKVASAAKSLAGPLALGAVVASFTSLMKKTIDYADRLDKLNLRLGVSVKEMDKLRQVGDLAGVSFNTLAMALQRMTRRVYEAADGGGPAADALERLGLNAEELIKLRPDEQFKLIAESLERVKNNSERVTLAFKLFDSEGVSVLQMTKDLKKSLAGVNSEMSEEKSKAAAEYVNQMTKLREATKQLAMKFLPTLTKGLKILMEIFHAKPPFDIDTASLDELKLELKLTSDEMMAFYKMTEKEREMFPTMRPINELRKLQKALRLVIKDKQELLGKGEDPDDDPKPLTSSYADNLTKEFALQHMAQIKTAKQVVAEYFQSLKEAEEAALKSQEEFNERLKKADSELYNSKINMMRQFRLKQGEEEDLIQNRNRERIAKELEMYAEKMEEQKRILEENKQKWVDFGNSVASSLGNAFGNFAVGAQTAEDAFRSFAKSVISGLAEIAAQKLAEYIISGLFSSTGGSAAGGSTLSVAGGAAGGIASGGFKAFQDGGMVTRPTLGLIGEGSMNEAVVPLPNGRSIPVEQKGGGGETIQNTFIIQAMDSKSFVEFTRRNPAAIIGPLTDSVNKGSGGLRNTLKKAVR